MLQDFMRKHKRTVLIFILVAICIPFIFYFGMPSTRNRNASNGRDLAVANIGGVPIRLTEYKRALDAASQRMTRGSKDKERPTYKQLAEDGTADRVLQQMIDSALITLKEKARGFDVDRSLLEERMHNNPQFQDENGKFSPTSWNEWVKASGKQDWNAMFDAEREQISRQIFLDAIMAPAGRVLDSEIQKEFEDSYTKIQVKYVKVDPKVEPADADIQKQYDDNKDKYKTPDTRVADFVMLSLTPPVPQEALDVVKQARDGADFAQLAKDHSQLKSENAHDLGWVSYSDKEMDFRQPMYKLQVGEVSDPVPAPNSYFIYKVTEERTTPEGKREIHPFQIMIKAELSEEDQAARKAKAEEIAGKIKEKKDIAAVAAEEKLEVKRTSPFTKESTEIDNVPKLEASQFRMGFENQAEDPVTITGRSNIYIAKIVEVTPGVIPPLEQVKDKVRTDAIAALKQKDEYKKQVEDYTNKIKEQAKSADQIPTLFPELGASVKESNEISGREMIYQDQAMLSGKAVFDAVGHKDPGVLAGPVKNFKGDSFFVELVKKTPPTDKDKENFEKDKKQIRENAQRVAENDLIEDYVADLRERMWPTIKHTIDRKLIDEMLGIKEGKSGGSDNSALLDNILGN